MKKHTRKFIGKQKVHIVDPTPEQFLRAVQTAEKMVLASIAQKKVRLSASETIVFLAMATKSALIGNPHFMMSEREIRETIFHILSTPEYIPCPDFPYTKEEMLNAGREKA